MITNIHFETFAPGMKAKLDPTYRRMPDSVEILAKLVRSSHDAVLPFTTIRKSYDFFKLKEY